MNGRDTTDSIRKALQDVALWNANLTVWFTCCRGYLIINESGGSANPTGSACEKARSIVSCAPVMLPATP